jgi:ribosomal protein L2
VLEVAENVGTVDRDVSTLFETYKPIVPGIRHLRRPVDSSENSPSRCAKRVDGTTAERSPSDTGGGRRRRIRLVDFVRKEPGPHDVVRIEYDPNKSAHVALIRSHDVNVEGIKKWN